MKRIVFITDNFPPEVNAPATRTFEHCKFWANEGHDVTVLTCVPNFPQGIVYSGYKNKFLQTQTIDGIRVIRVWSYITPNAGFLMRVLDYISFAIMAFFIGFFLKFDVVITTSPQFFVNFSGYFLKLIKRKKWVLELRDIWPESIKAVGAMKEGTVYKILEFFELNFYHYADQIITVTHSFKKQLTNRKINSQKIEVILNGADFRLFKPNIKSPPTSKMIVGYIGTLGMAHGLDFILKTIAKIQNNNIEFLFVGDGAEKTNLISLAEKLKLKNVTFMNPVAKNEISEVISKIDVGLVNLKKSDTFLSVVPSKIFELAIMSKPILLGVDGETRELIESNNIGLYFEPENEDQLITQLNKLMLDQELFKKIQLAGPVFAEQYNREFLAKKMLSIIIQKQI